MSYKIEITAETIAELTGKLLALAAATQPNDPVMPEVKEATKPKRAPKVAHVPSSGEAEAGIGSSTTTEAAAEAAEPDTSSGELGNDARPAEPTTDDTAAASVETTTGGTSTSGAPADAPETTPEALDFDKDVAPVVLEAVKQRGKDWVSEILSQFGVARASQVADEQMGELVAALKEGLK